MNITNQKLSLYKVIATNIRLIDAEGEHIGDNLPNSNYISASPPSVIYVAGCNLAEVATFLTNHKVWVAEIKLVSPLLSTE